MQSECSITTRTVGQASAVDALPTFRRLAKAWRTLWTFFGRIGAAGFDTAPDRDRLHRPKYRSAGGDGHRLP